MSISSIIDDHSRVRLHEIPNVPGSDYINGNYIDVRPAVVYCFFNESFFIYRDTINPMVL